jgi:hypothetical protein
MVGTTMDLVFVMKIVIQDMEKPCLEHWTTIKRIMKYLKCSLNLILCLRRNNITLHQYYDIDWVGDANDRRSIRNYVFFVDVGVVSWTCKKQPTIARSTIEVEYIASSHGALDTIWLKLLLKDIGLVQLEVTPLKCDNA